MTASEMQTQARDAQILRLASGREVGLAEYGDPAGLPVLALHGAPACRLMFRIADGAARDLGLRLVAPDRPGYGLTPPDDPATLQSRTAWLAEIADRLGLERFAILAISGGGPYAVSLAAHLSDRVMALGLVSPMGPIAEYSAAAEGAAHPVDFLHRRFFLHLPFRTWLTHPGGDLVAWLFRHGPDVVTGVLPKLAPHADAVILSRPEAAHFIRDMTLEALRQGGAGGTRDLEIYARPWGVDFPAVTAPAVLWQGTADTIVVPQVAEYLAGLLPRCTLKRLEGAGHFWVLDHVAEVLGGLKDLIVAGKDASVR